MLSLSSHTSQSVTLLVPHGKMAAGLVLIALPELILLISVYISHIQSSHKKITPIGGNSIAPTFVACHVVCLGPVFHPDIEHLQTRCQGQAIATNVELRT